MHCPTGPVIRPFRYGWSTPAEYRLTVPCHSSGNEYSTGGLVRADIRTVPCRQCIPDRSCIRMGSYDRIPWSPSHPFERSGRLQRYCPDPVLPFRSQERCRGRRSVTIRTAWCLRHGSPSPQPQQILTRRTKRRYARRCRCGGAARYVRAGPTVCAVSPVLRRGPGI